MKTKPKNEICQCGNKTTSGRKYCGTCSVKVQRLRYKIALVNYKGGRCEQCGIDDLFLLDFHHINPEEKLFRISDCIRSWDKFKKEVDKCKLLCANCHRTEHKKDYFINLYEDAVKYQGRNEEVTRYLSM